MHYDVFNGDADGIIALLQLRLAKPIHSQLITGVKRDTALLRQVERQPDVTSVSVLDISLEKNIDALSALLARKVEVFYCDHHRAGDIPDSNYLTSRINTDSEVCTSLLVNEELNGRYLHWAIAAAYGDNLHSTADKLAIENEVSDADREYLKELGTLINYNGYGASVEDLHIPPVDLYRQLLPFESPFQLREDTSSPYYQLKSAYQQDRQFVDKLSPVEESSNIRVFELPPEAWARRISGVFGNELANQEPNKAHAVLTLNPNKNDFTVSVRAPLNNRVGADEVCCQFVTGGGRKAAAGINQLPLTEKAVFIDTLNRYYD
ncbi:DHH family phosphoesterase [Vibrio marisflavi]|uniref:Acetyltransferase n=1 Tax=Vibrio marisflavi CECT 7928 TaxID=634439 RepID=A0ABM9A7Y5_9VIBR|nr:DHH family phosphoesterase [Vibrio marisflavi]CAH0541695.1 hypothetical protein VMF7928_03761 [Vibrio marisflavi CECT 7928]